MTHSLDEILKGMSYGMGFECISRDRMMHLGGIGTLSLENLKALLYCRTKSKEKNLLMDQGGNVKDYFEHSFEKQESSAVLARDLGAKEDPLGDHEQRNANRGVPTEKSVRISSWEN